MGLTYLGIFRHKLRLTAAQPHSSRQSPQEIETKIKAYLAAWKEPAPNATFADLTLEQFTVLVQPSLAARTEIGKLDAQRATLENTRNDADKYRMSIEFDIVERVNRAESKKQIPVIDTKQK